MYPAIAHKQGAIKQLNERQTVKNMHSLIIYHNIGRSKRPYFLFRLWWLRRLRGRLSLITYERTMCVLGPIQRSVFFRGRVLAAVATGQRARMMLIRS